MAGSGLAPKVAVIIPVFEHPGMLCEAVTSCASQVGDTDFRVLLVNDGCRHSQTDDTCRQYVAAHAPDMLYLRNPVNRGVSHARNAGVRLALQAWPSIEGILFLDADDRLRKDGVDSLHKAFCAARVDTDKNIGWVFSDPYQFGGIHSYGRKVQEYSVL